MTDRRSFLTHLATFVAGLALLDLVRRPAKTRRIAKVVVYDDNGDVVDVSIIDPPILMVVGDSIVFNHRYEITG